MGGDERDPRERDQRVEGRNRRRRRPGACLAAGPHPGREVGRHPDRDRPEDEDGGLEDPDRPEQLEENGEQGDAEDRLGEPCRSALPAGQKTRAQTNRGEGQRARNEGQPMTPVR
jgi:hypothetical protein